MIGGGASNVESIIAEQREEGEVSRTGAEGMVEQRGVFVKRNVFFCIVFGSEMTVALTGVGG